MIIARVAELAEKRGVTMTEASLAWLLTKVTSPVVGATKLHHIEGAVKAVDLTLSPEEILDFGGALRSASSGGRYGTEQTGSSKRKACLVHGGSEDRIINGGRDKWLKESFQTAGRNQLGEFAPMYAHLNDDVLFGEV